MDQSEIDSSTEAASDSSAEQTQRTSPASSDSSAGGDKSTDEPTDSEDNSARTASGGSGDGAKRRRGSRGGQSRRGAGTGDGPSASVAEESSVEAGPTGADDRNDVEMPEPLSEGRPSAEASEKALVRRPKIGDTMPVPNEPPHARATAIRNQVTPRTARGQVHRSVVGAAVAVVAEVVVTVANSGLGRPTPAGVASQTMVAVNPVHRTGSPRRVVVVAGVGVAARVVSPRLRWTRPCSNSGVVANGMESRSGVT